MATNDLDELLARLAQHHRRGINPLLAWIRDGRRQAPLEERK